MPLAANDPTDRIEQLIILTERLTSLIERETELLADHRPHEIQDFQDERAKLSNLYVQEMELIKRNKALIEGVPTVLSDELKEATATFQDRLGEHARVLSRVRTVTENMVKSIADEISKKDQFDGGYGENGQSQNSEQGTPKPIAIHEVI